MVIYFITECNNSYCNNIQVNYTHNLRNAHVVCRTCGRMKKLFNHKTGRQNVPIIRKSEDSRFIISLCKEIKIEYERVKLINKSMARSEFKSANKNGK